MIIGETKVGNTIIRCDDSCVVRDPVEAQKIRDNLAAIVFGALERQERRHREEAARKAKEEEEKKKLQQL